MSAVTVETATVYRGGGRRYFSKGAAMRGAAKAIIRNRCECERPDHSTNYPGFRCDWHADPARFARAAHLLIVMFIRPAFRKESSHG